MLGRPAFLLKKAMRSKPRIAAGVAVLTVVGAAFLGAGLYDDGRGGGEATYDVTFPIRTLGHDVGSGNLPYDDRTSYTLNVSSSNLTRIECTLQWSDQGSTPLQDPYVNLYISHEQDQELWYADELPAPGGTIGIDVPNEVPRNATVPAMGPEEAISAASSTRNGTARGVGNWSIDVSAQAPSSARPFVGGGISYSVSCDTLLFEGQAARRP